MDRVEHLAWAKARAHHYVRSGDLQGAVMSMLSDLSKHGELQDISGKMAMLGIFSAGSRRDTERFIDGFN